MNIPWDKIDKTAYCWNWIGVVNNKGYGEFNTNGKTIPAHRLIYEIFVGRIPFGLQIDHLCRNRKCVNPAHLEAVTRKINILRGEGAAAKNSRKTHCPQGHHYGGLNLHVYFIKNKQTMGRYCKACRVEANRRWRRKIGMVPRK